MIRGFLQRATCGTGRVLIQFRKDGAMALRDAVPKIHR
jgi:hypothetical protein